MTPMNVYTRTMKFVWLKLALGAGAAVVGGLIFGLVALIAGAVGGGFGGFLLWVGVALGFGFWAGVTYYFGYLLKAGHVAVAAAALHTGVIPEDQLHWGLNMVKSRFLTANVYYMLDRMVSGAVTQIQRAVGMVTRLLEKLPGGSVVKTFANQFVENVLGNVDECCLGWCFLHPEQGSFKSSCDGISICFQNSRQLLKAGARITAITTLITTLVLGLCALIVIVSFHQVSVGLFVGLAVMAAVVLSAKAAFLNSYVMIAMMSAFLEVAPSTVLTYDLYAKLCGLSNKFRKLYDRAREETAPVL